MDDAQARHRRTVAISTVLGAVVSVGAIGAPLWQLFLRPALAQSVSEQLTDSLDRRIDSTVTERLKPVQEGLKAIIRGNIMALEEDIARLEFLRDYTQEWSSERQQELLRKQGSLSIQREALTAIVQAERR